MSTKVFNRFIFIMLVLGSTGLPQTTLPTYAVLDFDGRGISPSEAATLSDRLASEIANTKVVTLVERKQMDKIIAEQGLQQSGCVSAECVAEVGKLLGVQFMVSGSVNKLGNSYTVEAKVFSVETGAYTQTVSKTHRGEIDELIPIMEEVAWELVGKDKKPLETVAILDFDGRGISSSEAATLTDRFSSELGSTGAILLVARNEMNEILTEQGLNTGGDCSSIECAAEIGAMLGVEKVINGAIGKLGETYTIDARMIKVSNGATIKTVSNTYQGKIDGLITEIEIMAWQIVDLDPPKSLLMMKASGSPVLSQSRPKTKSRMGAAVRSLFIPGLGQFYSNRKLFGYGYLSAELAVGAFIFLTKQQYTTAKTSFTKYNTLYLQESEDVNKMYEYKRQAHTEFDSMTSQRQKMVQLAQVAGGIWAVNIIHAFITGPKQNQNVGFSDGVKLVYAENPNQIQVRFEIALD